MTAAAQEVNELLSERITAEDEEAVQAEFERLEAEQVRERERGGPLTSELCAQRAATIPSLDKDKLPTPVAAPRTEEPAGAPTPVLATRSRTD